MHIPLLAVSAFLATATALASGSPTTTNVSSAAVPSSTGTGKFYLQTKVKSTETGKGEFDGLYVHEFEPVFDASDALLTANRSEARVIHPSYGAVSGVPGPAPYFSAVCEIDGSNKTWQILPDYGVNYQAGWQPVRINAAVGGPNNANAFYIKDNALQWTNYGGQLRPANFYGWIVCEWWHDNAKQLFFQSLEATRWPSTCAAVDLVPVYI